MNIFHENAQLVKERNFAQHRILSYFLWFGIDAFMHNLHLHWGNHIIRWRHLEVYGWIYHTNPTRIDYITTTTTKKHKTVCIFYEIWCLKPILWLKHILARYQLFFHNNSRQSLNNVNRFFAKHLFASTCNPTLTRTPTAWMVIIKHDLQMFTLLFPSETFRVSLSCIWTLIVYTFIEWGVRKGWCFAIDYLSLFMMWLTHWSRLTHICVDNLTIIGSDNDLSPCRRQAIIWTNVRLLLNGPLGTYLSETWIQIQQCSFKKIDLKMSSGKCRPSCLSLNVLTK